MSKPVVENNVPIYQAYKNGEYVGVIDVLKGDPGRESPSGYEYRSTTVALDHRFDDDPLIAAWISDFKARHKI
ncbi:MAG: hypothetical protein JXD19_12890, partial [Deltaproteobacteria bacterium]|nr:hypothetical protein [Deltaproteobacteria bacterium]